MWRMEAMCFDFWNGDLEMTMILFELVQGSEVVRLELLMVLMTFLICGWRLFYV